jgi:NADPH-dependent 2,4-dienoyl-CoA reductase/sulfur reductase-like enzyme
MSDDGVGREPVPRDAGRVVIVGGGLAGFSAAEALRNLGHEGSITVIDSEPGLYDRPPLSKELFDDDLGLDRLAFATGLKLSDARIDVHTNRVVTRIDPDVPSVALDSDDTLAADTILLATGGRARPLSIPGADSPNVFTLRTLADARAISSALHAGSRAVVIGGGLIGSEVASSLRRGGAEVTIIDPAPLPMAGVLGDGVASLLHDLHRRKGVGVRVGSPTAIESGAIESSRDSVDVVLGDGERIPADFVVVGIGIIPNDELARSAGIEVDNGILVDDYFRTSAPGVFAAGDVARRRGSPGLPSKREEHWEAAQLNGKAAAASMLGLPAEPRGAPWFWSDRHGIHFEMVGRLVGSGTIVQRESGGHASTFLIDDGVLVGAASIDDPTVVRASRRLIDRRVPVTATELSDPSVSLRSLLKAVV